MCALHPGGGGGCGGEPRRCDPCPARDSCLECVGMGDQGSQPNGRLGEGAFSQSQHAS